ncbi:MAG: hypothetical protein IK099_12355 [Clostridia bacterium]|nr:hypothetical protein [Clostridia bacterium]
MMENAARAQKWMLWSAPAMALAGFITRAGGAAAAFSLWMGLGLLLAGKEKRAQQYPKQRRMKLHRLILGYSFCVFCLAGWNAAGLRLLKGGLTPAADYLFTLGNIGFSLTLGARAIAWRLRKRISLALALFFFLLSVLLFYTHMSDHVQLFSFFHFSY